MVITPDLEKIVCRSYGSARRRGWGFVKLMVWEMSVATGVTQRTVWRWIDRLKKEELIENRKTDTV